MWRARRWASNGSPLAGAGVGGTQMLALPGGDAPPRQARREQRLDERAVRALDPDPRDPVRLQTTDEPTQPGLRVLDDQPLEDTAGGVHDTGRVIGAGPVHAGEPDTGVDGRADGNGGIVHVCLLAVAAAGKHPVVSGRARRSLTDRRSRRSALSPVGTSRATGSCVLSLAVTSSKPTRQ